MELFKVKIKKVVRYEPAGPYYEVKKKVTKPYYYVRLTQEEYNMVDDLLAAYKKLGGK